MNSQAQLAAKKTLEESLREIVMNWLQQFPGLMAHLTSEQASYSSYFPDRRVQDFVDLIIDQYRGKEREKLVCDLLTDRNAEDCASVVKILDRNRDNPISTQDLALLVGVCEGYTGWQLQRLVYRVLDLFNQGKIGNIFWSPTRAKFLRLFVNPNIVAHGHVRSFDQEMLRRFFKLLRLPDESLEKICQLSESMHKTYFNFFFFNLLETYTTPFIRELCVYDEGSDVDVSEEEVDKERMLKALCYLVLLKGEYDIEHPAAPHFVTVLEKNRLAEKRYAVSEYTSVGFGAPLFDDHFHGLNWTLDLVATMMEIKRDGKDLFTALVELVVKTEGEALNLIKRLFPTDENPDLTLLTAMVFDYPAYLSSLRFYRLDREYFEDHFVKFTGYENRAAAKKMMQREDVGQVHLLNSGRDPARAFNTLQSAGVYVELLAVDASSPNLQILTCPPGEDGFVCIYFEANTMVHAHQTEWLNGRTLLQTLLTTDEVRLKLLVRTMYLFFDNYLERDAEDQSQNMIVMSQDFIRSGLMEAILNLNPPELIAVLSKFDLDIDRCVEVLFRDMKKQLEQYPRLLQVIGLNMMLRAFNTASAFLINMEQNEKAFDHFILFLADQFKSFVQTAGTKDSVSGKFQQTTEDKAIAYLLNKPANSQSRFEQHIKDALSEFGVQELKTFGKLL